MIPDGTTAQRALAISREAAQVGFDWDSAADVVCKLFEEVGEVQEALASGASCGHIQEEVGDLYFTLINFCRKMQIDPDVAFHAGVAKFERRFNALADLVRRSGHQMGDVTQDELERLWAEVKKAES